MEAPAWRVEEFRELDSTQDELRRRLDAGQDIDGLVLRAGVQTGGRGQRARDWQSGEGGSWQSAALLGHALPASSLFVAICVARQLNSALSGTGVMLKWPNDILLDGLKVAGILCEYTRRHLLVGVGVNVSNEVPEGAGTLGQLELDQVHRLVLDGISAGWQMMHLRAEQLAAAYAELDSLRGRELEFSRAGESYRGIASGVDLVGRLRLETAQGIRLLDSVSSLKQVQAS